MRVRRLRPIAATLLACVASAGFAIAAGAQTAPPTIYKWVDENGIAHYTTDRERIPSVLRDRVESVATKSTPGEASVAGQPNRADLMRDAVPTSPAPAAAPAAVAATPPTAPEANVDTIAAPIATNTAPIAAPAATPIETEAVVEPEPEAAVEAQTEPAREVEIEAEPTEIAAPAPIEPDLREENAAVSAAPPPAAPIELEPTEQAAVAELDQQIEGVEAEIAQREETLAALISTSDEERTTPLVDDPEFREISQRLPKLQADLQTLRERRNKIQPTAPTP